MISDRGERYGYAVTVVRRCALMVPMMLLFTACAEPVTGEPVPAAGFRDEPTTSASTPTASPPEIDPCALLAPEDLAPFGGPAGHPHPDQPFPGACTHPLTNGPANAAAAGFYDPVAAVTERQPGGAAVDVEGRPAWLYCELVDAHQTCTAATSLGPDRSLLTMLTLRDASAADTADHLFGLTTAALRRLSPA
ncbi:Protein of unknown function [Saccharopolyspora antimicrobica]|uniref:DUF3558 domain-containing protein n=1 Tax=Saccharopolyspora antimicrobica TaxID=455193 RepID=A0A1I4Z562_9PSEU|nr:Protein of unknown function (DUF3558) [Saccharopolyspora antimicrobica]SFN45348.1 Protein of unknown function [Saccharopolyspora antimicrobica]